MLPDLSISTNFDLLSGLGFQSKGSPISASIFDRSSFNCISISLPRPTHGTERSATLPDIEIRRAPLMCSAGVASKGGSLTDLSTVRKSLDQYTPDIWITPGIQLIVEPTFNPSTDLVAIPQFKFRAFF